MIRNEINLKLKKIIEYFEVGKDNNVKISKDNDQSSLQYINMIMDVVMPYKNDETKLEEDHGK